MEFRNQDLRDILLSFGELNGVSIVPDETVEGKATYIFTNMQFGEAFQRFLSTFHLFATKRENVYLVSRVSVSARPDGLVDLQTYEVPTKTIIQIVATSLSQAVLYDSLPNDPVTLSLQGVSLTDILKVLTAKYPDYAVQKQDKYYYIRNTAIGTNTQNSSVPGVSRNGDKYSLQLQKARFRDTVATLFRLAKIQYVMVMDRDILMDSLNLTDLTWEAALKTVLLFGNADFAVSQDIYYIIEAQRRDLLKKYLVNVVVPLEYISSTDFLRLLPSELASGNAFKLDDKNNRIVLSGSQEQIAPIWDFIKAVDQPLRKNGASRFDLSFIRTDELFPLFPPELSSFNPQPLPGKMSFVLTAPPARLDEVREFIALVDRPQPGLPVRLKYLKADDLVAKLPPSVTETNIVRTSDPALVFFRGTLAQQRDFMEDLAVIDLPRAQLRYEIFVLQFDEGKGLGWDAIPATSSLASSVMSMAGNFTSLRGLNFDVIANLGSNFARSLVASLKSNDSKVLADTTLTGLAGEKLSFQNTQTIRYASSQVNPDTGKFVEVIRDLPSGLLLGLEGWVSSDNMITVKVDSTLSQAVVSTSSAGAATPAPSTFEKKISTTVRTQSGRPLVLSGLKQDQTSSVVSRIPILGDIPLLGAFFQTRTESVSRTEFAIYIVPILERIESQEATESGRLSIYYDRWSRLVP